MGKPRVNTVFEYLANRLCFNDPSASRDVPYFVISVGLNLVEN